MATSVSYGERALIRRRKLNQNHVPTSLCDLQDYDSDRNIIRRTQFQFCIYVPGWVVDIGFESVDFSMVRLGCIQNQKVLGTDSKPRCVFLRRASQSDSRDECKCSHS